MSRPTKLDIDAGIQSWDGKIDDNFEALFDAPLPIHAHTGNESDLASTFPAAAYDRCWVMVNHSSLGWCLYVSTGSTWVRMLRITTSAITALTDSTGGTANNTLEAVGGSYSQSVVANNFADLAAKVNEIRTALVNHGLIT